MKTNDFDHGVDKSKKNNNKSKKKANVEVVWCWLLIDGLAWMIYIRSVKVQLKALQLDKNTKHISSGNERKAAKVS